MYDTFNANSDRFSVAREADLDFESTNCFVFHVKFVVTVWQRHSDSHAMSCCRDVPFHRNQPVDGQCVLLHKVQHAVFVTVSLRWGCSESSLIGIPEASMQARSVRLMEVRKSFANS